MDTQIFTGNYGNCKYGDLISISGDRGKLVGFKGKALPPLAPKIKFWKIWHDNIGKIPEEENTKYYIEEYYKQVLSKTNIMNLLKDEKRPILLCYEDPDQFCHRHVLADYIELKYGIIVPEIKILENSENPKNFEIVTEERPKYIMEMLKQTIEKCNEYEKLDQ